MEWKRSGISNCLISTEPTDLYRDRAEFFGKLKSNVVNQLTVFDNGFFELKGDKREGKDHFLELVHVIYYTNVMGFT